MKVKIGRDQAWDYVKNDWRIKEMDVVYSLDTKEDISIAFELTNILQKTIENYWYNKSRCPTVPETLIEEQCFLNLSREYFEDKNSCRKIRPLMFGSKKTKRKMKRKVLVEREIGKREWDEWINREKNQEEE